MTTSNRHRQQQHLHQQQVNDVTAVRRCFHTTRHFKRHITALLLSLVTARYLRKAQVTRLVWLFTARRIYSAYASHSISHGQVSVCQKLVLH